MQFPDSFFEDEVRDGFFVPGLMKHAWAAQMEILADVDKVCKKHNIQWFADSGTLLGAIRHSGYIPWDDDLDICMLRDDYNRFLAVAEEELPEGYYIPKNRDAGRWMFTSVFNGSSTFLDKERLEKFHGFPLCTFIDIFVLDYLASDPEDEEYRIHLAELLISTAMAINKQTKSQEEIEIKLKQIEHLLPLQIDRTVSIQEQLFGLAEHVFSLFTKENATEVACMPSWVSRRACRYPLEYYQEAVMLPFECMEIAVPRDYLKAIKIQYGETYMQPCRTGSCHGYPSYREVESLFPETASLLSRYTFSKSDLERPIWKDSSIRPGKAARDFVQHIHTIHGQISSALYAEDFLSAASLLETCQTMAIQVGTMLEQLEGTYFFTVKLLEEYCEQLYQTHKALSGNPFDLDIQLLETHSMHTLNLLMEQIETSIKKDIPQRKEVVFLPFKAAAWESLEPAWKKAMADSDCDVYVIPVPYYYKSLTEDFATLYYEGNDFPDYVTITDYNTYDFESRLPDVIFFHNPYDNCSFSTSVHPYFYSSNLKKYTRQLVYIPYFQTDEIAPDDMQSIYNMRYYVTVPGLMHADKILVQSEQMRLAYINCLTEFAGKDTQMLWEEKIIKGDLKNGLSPFFF